MVATCAGDDRVATAEAVLPHEVRRHVRVAGLGEIAALRATNEPAVARGIEPAQRLGVSDDWRRWLMRLVLLFAVTSATAVSAIAAAVAVELLIRSAAILAAVVAMVVAVFPPVVLGALIVLPVLAVLRGWRLLAVLLAGLSGSFGRRGWWRRWR
jgi:uncharacterized membrane protein YdbT with pleckstrin-like domain